MNCLWVMLNMEKMTVQDTIAYKIVRQILDHIFSSDFEMSDADFMGIYRAFINTGGSWQKLLAGSVAEFDRLKGLVRSFAEISSEPDKYGIPEEHK